MPCTAKRPCTIFTPRSASFHRVALEALATALVRRADGPDANRRDLIAALAQNFEAVAVERESLAGLGDGLRLMDDETGDGGRLLVRQRPVHLAIEIADRHRAVDIHRAVRLHTDRRVVQVVLVRDLAHVLLEYILDRVRDLHLAAR